VSAALRLLGRSWLFHVKTLSMSSFYLLSTVFLPLILATTAFELFRVGGQPGTLLYVALGCGFMGVWSTTLFGCGGAIQWQRWQGMLELLIAAPAPFPLVLLALTLATASIGIYAIAATLAWGWLLYGMPLTVAHPLALCAAVPAAVVSLGLLGLLMAATFVLYRNANALSNLLEYPVWLITGLLVPLAALPGWVLPISWARAPTWGAQANRRAALGGDAWPAIAMCIALGAAYAVVAVPFLRHFERLARERATLSLT
jgi:ABC-2 type transport system permease protein